MACVVVSLPPQEDLAGHDQLHVVELAFLVGREDQRRQHVVGHVLPVRRRRPPPLDLGHEVLREFHQ